MEELALESHKLWDVCVNGDLHSCLQDLATVRDEDSA